MVRSWYMRTPHWTAEFAWFFELKLTTAIKEEMLRDPQTRPITKFTESDLRRRIYREKPSWFLPEKLEEYDLYESGSVGDFLIFVERAGDKIFWTSFQL